MKKVCTRSLNSCNGAGEMLASIQLPPWMCPACDDKRTFLYSACPAAPRLVELISHAMWCTLLPWWAPRLSDSACMSLCSSRTENYRSLLLLRMFPDDILEKRYSGIGVLEGYALTNFMELTVSNNAVRSKIHAQWSTWEKLFFRTPGKFLFLNTRHEAADTFSA